MTEFTSTSDLVDAFYEEAQVSHAGFHDYGGKLKFSGEIQTVWCYEDSTHVAGSLDSEGHGKVLVVDGAASLRMALTGDQVLGRGLKNGWAGIVIHGCVRDVVEVRELQIGVKALASSPGKRLRRGDGFRNIPVSFLGVDYVPGDYLFADETGIIVLPREIALKNGLA